MRQVLFYPSGGFDEIHRIVVVLLDAGRDRQNVRIKNNVLRRKAHFLGKQLVTPRANLSFALERVGLTLLIERHYHDRCAITFHQLRLLQKFLFAFLEADRVHDPFALNAFEPGLQHRPLRAVDHYRNADLGFRREEMKEVNHGLFGIEHSFVHVHVDDLRAVLDLLTRNSYGVFVLTTKDTLVRSPMFTKFVSGRTVSGSRPLRRRYGSGFGGMR